MKKIILFSSALLASLAAVFLVQEFYTPIKKLPYKYSPTDFIEPSATFTKCYINDDCLKVKGSACPPDTGGVDTCVNKNYMQEYLSEIEELEGKEWEVTCPQIDKTNNYECFCVNNTCKMVS